ncbi:MAG: glycosyltransferase family 39 protein [Clostridiaceae bacterium]|nr:glycosyltransferase family 39 protein [Clostridiaceae bacterium]
MKAKTFEFLKKYNFPILLAIGVILRLLWIFIFPTVPETDFMWYHVKGVEISQGKGFLNGIYPYYVGQPGQPTAFRPIGYPGTLAVLYFLFGSDYIVGKLFNVALSTLIMFLTYKLADRFFGKRIAFITLLIFALSPLAITYNSIHCSEILFSALLMLSIYLFYYKNNPFIIGIIIGYLTLVRPIGMFFPAIFVLYMFIRKDILIKDKLKYVAAFGLSVALVITPWLVRNYFAFGEPVFSTNGGYVFYVNNNDHATGSWSDPYKYPDSPFLKYKTDTGFDEMAIHKLGKELAVEWIKENPRFFLSLAVKRIANSYWYKTDDIMWSLTTGINTWHPWYTKAIIIEKLLYRPFYIVLFAFIIYAVIRFLMYRKTDFTTFILLVFLYFNAMMFVLEGNSRYVFPLHPIYTIGVAFIIYEPLKMLLAKKFAKA